MFNLRIPFTFGNGACGASLLTLGIATFALAQAPADSPPPAVDVAAHRQLKLRYSQTCLELAKIDLQLIEEANRRVPDNYSPAEIDRLQNNVKLAEERVRLAQQSQDDDDFIAVQKLRAEQAAARAKRDYFDALERRRLDPAYSELKLKRLQLEAEKAQLQLAMWDDPAATLIEHIHWELGRVSDQVLHLEKRLDDLLQQIGQP